MVTRDFSGYDVAKVLNTGNFQWARTPGDHAILKREHPDGPDVEKRTVSVLLHDRVQTGRSGVSPRTQARRVSTSSASGSIGTALQLVESQEGIEPFDPR